MRGVLVRLQELRRFEHEMWTIHDGRVRSIGKWVDGMLGGADVYWGDAWPVNVFMHLQT